MKINRLTLIPCLVAFGLVAARADVGVWQDFAMPAHATVNVNESDCQNSGGPWITLDGQIALGGLRVNLIFQNNAKGTHTAVVYTTNVAVLNLGQSITIPKQPVRGGVGGNPYIYLSIAGQNEIYLGRCVQGLTVPADLIIAALATANISVGGCDNSGGPTITLGGDITLGGVNATIIFRNNVRGTHTAEVSTTVNLVLAGSSITIPKQPVLGGAGGNPLISIQFLQGNGTPIADPILLGRCNKL
jgi:hypothetical protein